MKVKWEHRPRTAPMGRFGGGWQWNLGFQAGGKTLIVNLLIGYVRITRA